MKNHIKTSLPTRAADLGKYTFWHYTSIQSAKAILEHKSIWISNINAMNDRDEISIHENEKDIVHSICFCNSNTEKIPMWYLYSGIAGKGAAIGLTPSVMMKLLKSINTLKTTDDNTILYKGTDFDLKYGWVFYRKSQETRQVNYRNKWFTLEDPDTFLESNYFVKVYPWEYEKEFRIVFVNKTATAHEKLVLDISSVIRKLVLKLAPEINDTEYEGLRAAFTLPNSTQKIKEIKRSELDIDMQLCQRNYESFLKYVESLVTNENTQVENVEKIRSIICPVCKMGNEEK